jgi:hypothetical protein
MRETFLSKSEMDKTEASEIETGIADYEAEKNGEKEEIKLIYADVFFEKEGKEAVEEIYDWYQKAINRRNREPLSEERFIHHFFEQGSTENIYMFGDMDGGFLLGIMKSEVFIPTHFAPRTMRRGYELLKQLGKGDMPVVLSITDDLAQTIKKMPEWQLEEGIQIPSIFRGEDTKKNIVHNRDPKIKNLMVELLAEYLNSLQSDDDNHQIDYSNRW